MAKILFLDDNPARLNWARRAFVGHDLTLTETAAETCRALASGAWDHAFLDHDLGGEVFVSTSEDNTGSGVVRWMVANRPVVGQVTVHSLNAPAANRMAADLRGAGYAVEVVNFLRLVELTEAR